MISLLQVAVLVGLLIGGQVGHAAGRQLTSTTGGGPKTPSDIYYDNSKDYMLLGCFKDGDSQGRAIEMMEGATPGKVSADHCAALARSKGLYVFATQSSDWCHGGDKNAVPGVLTKYRDAEYNFTCDARCSDPAAADVACGGFFANTVYVFKGKEGYTDLGCYSYNTEIHQDSTDLTGSSGAKMSPAECYRLSSAYDFFGLVDGNRCIGFSSLQEAAVAPATDHGACSVPCSGAAGAKCGGKASMQLYARNKPLPQLAPVSVSPSDYVYLGCVADEHYHFTHTKTPGLEAQLLHGNNAVDTTYCASAARRAGKKFFGTKISTFCMGGNSLVRALRYSKKRAVCDQPCAASDLPEHKCGGGWGSQSMSLYVRKTGKDYTNLGCYVLRPDRDPLPELVLDRPRMTPGFCYKKAAAYKFFAVFNGTRCYGGNDLGPSLRKSKSSKECTIPCKGRNSKQTCGGSEAFQLYVNHAAPVVPPPTPEPKRAPAAKPLAASASRPKVSAGRTPVVFTEVVDQNLGQMVDAMELPADVLEMLANGAPWDEVLEALTSSGSEGMEGEPQAPPADPDASGLAMEATEDVLPLTPESASVDPAAEPTPDAAPVEESLSADPAIEVTPDVAFAQLPEGSAPSDGDATQDIAPTQESEGYAPSDGEATQDVAPEQESEGPAPSDGETTQDVATMLEFGGLEPAAEATLDVGDAPTPEDPAPRYWAHWVWSRSLADVSTP